MDVEISNLVDPADILRAGHLSDHANSMLGKYMWLGKSQRPKRASPVCVESCHLYRSGAYFIGNAATFSPPNRPGDGWRAPSSIFASAKGHRSNQTSSLVFHLPARDRFL